jgi:hypothetical protein
MAIVEYSAVLILGANSQLLVVLPFSVDPANDARYPRNLGDGRKDSAFGALDGNTTPWEFAILQTLVVGD